MSTAVPLPIVDVWSVMMAPFVRKTAFDRCTGHVASGLVRALVRTKDKHNERARALSLAATVAVLSLWFGDGSLIFTSEGFVNAAYIYLRHCVHCLPWLDNLEMFSSSSKSFRTGLGYVLASCCCQQIFVWGENSISTAQKFSLPWPLVSLPWPLVEVGVARRFLRSW